MMQQNRNCGVWVYVERGSYQVGLTPGVLLTK